MRMTWNELWMNMVYLISMKSRDERTKVGEIIVTKDNRLVSAYNGMPRGVDYAPERQERPEKYSWFEHAERNSIYLAKCDLEGCIMYTNGMPCTDCARAIIQSGIKKVIVDKKWVSTDTRKKWKEEFKRTRQLFLEGGVETETIDVDFVKICRFREGKKF